jgi:hypothetical protein
MTDEADLPLVRMEQAFRWFCPGCEVENFDRALATKFTSQEEEQAACQELGIPEDATGGFVEIPTTVTCRNCLLLCATDDSPHDYKSKDDV